MIDLYLLGASGSIGRQTIDIISNYKKQFRIVAMSVGRDLSLAQDLVDKVKPELVCLRNESDKINTTAKICYGDSGLLQIACFKASNNRAILINALVGSAGLKPTVVAIQNKKDIALANKETLVMAGDLIKELVKQYNVKLTPIDSEHNAIWQCLKGENKKDVKELIITASGGSFRNKKRSDLVNVTKEDALKHPNWQMGAKITIDSATMMNKGFEVIEAHYLFDMPYSKIKTIMHKESIVHSLVLFNDLSLKALLGHSDMRIPILYALSYPKHLKIKNIKQLDLAGLNLHFKELSFKRFPLLKAAYYCGNLGKLYPTVLNAANEAAVKLFLEDKISFLEIEDIIFSYINKNYDDIHYNLDNILEINEKIQTEILKKYGDDK